MSEGRGQGGYIAHVGGNAFQSAVSQLQTVVERIVLRHLGQILGVGLEDPFLIINNGIGYGIENVVPLPVAHQGQTLAGPLHLFKCRF